MTTFDPAVSEPAQIRRAGVDLSGVMSVLSKHLYSTPMVALRELVQNAHDSILRRRQEQPDWQGPSRIEVIGNSAQNTVRIIDTGAGLTESEIHEFLATVGVSYTRGLRQENPDDSGLIGMFGLGFLSAFVLAKRVTVRTTSYQTPELGFVYVSSNAEQYSVSPMPARPVGTEILLELQDDFGPLTRTAHLREILGRYCVLLREPIYVGEEAQPINPAPPPWRDQSALALPPPLQQRRNLEFAARFEHNFEPICCMPVQPEGASDAIGLLWVQDGGTYGTTDNRNLSVFLRGMLLDDDARDLLPPWAGFIGGVIESSRLTPTASREDLQRDSHYNAIQHALGEALVAGLLALSKSQPQAWRRVLARHNEALLGACLCDERLFALLMDSVKVPTSQGDLPTRELLFKGALYVILDNESGFEEMLFRAMGAPVALGNRYAVVPFLRRWAEARKVRLIELGTEQGNRQLFQLADLDEQSRQWLHEHLAHEERLVAARFSPAELPLVVVPDHEAQLKQRLEQDQNDKRVSTSALRLARQFTQTVDSTYLTRLYLNLDNPAIQALIQAVGVGNPQSVDAARLLKAFKVIIAGQGNAPAAPSLNQALIDLAGAVQRLLDK
ncbi:MULTISPECIES: ATP-binding protein [unclassified Pseudomonas]|uniref:ATP-binding protein n=1 Tax=unclassified Pseudomonas TaxID=196821 RepID=UPI0025DDC8A4|nr:MULTISPECIES: ATP-binding protein [unclassified Pseudomonas]